MEPPQYNQYICARLTIQYVSYHNYYVLVHPGRFNYLVCVMVRPSPLHRPAQTSFCCHFLIILTANIFSAAIFVLLRSGYAIKGGLGGGRGIKMLLRGSKYLKENCRLKFLKQTNKDLRMRTQTYYF